MTLEFSAISVFKVIDLTPILFSTPIIEWNVPKDEDVMIVMCSV